MRQFLNALVLCLFVLPPAAEGADQLDETEIDGLVATAMQRFQIPGIAVGVIKDGELVFAKGYGVREFGKPDPVSASTLFGIASNTKAMTAAAIAILVDEGVLDWDDKVTDWLPDFRMYDAWVGEEFTIRDLLTHRSGLPLGAGDLLWFGNPIATRHDVVTAMQHLRPVTSFRTRFAYNNLAYIVAGEVVSAASGTAWENFVEERIFTPLGMPACKAVRSHLPEGVDEAAPHVLVDGMLKVAEFTLSEPASSAAAVQCNIEGMAKWVAMQLDEGDLPGGGELFSEARHNEMWSPETNLPVNARARQDSRTHFSAYGLGWFLTDRDGRLRVSHTGGLLGMTTQTTLIPEEELGVLVFTNQMDGGAMRAITNQILDAYLGREPRDWVEIIGDQGDERRARAAAEIARARDERPAEIGATVPPSTYAGTYTDAWYGEVRIFLRDGVLRFSALRTPAFKGRLEHFSVNTFIVRWDDRRLDADAYITFETGRGRGFESARMEAISPLTDFSFDWHHLELKRVND